MREINLDVGQTVTIEGNIYEIIKMTPFNKKPTIEELEAILEGEKDVDIEILPNGEIKARNQLQLKYIGEASVENSRPSSWDSRSARSPDAPAGGWRGH